MPPHGPALSVLDTLCCPETDGPTNLEKPTLNHVQSDTMATAILAHPTRAPQGTNRGSGAVMEESENDVGSLEQLLLYADEHYLAGKLPLGDHLGKVLHGVAEYHQRNVGTLRFPTSQLKWTGYHRL
ncbi:15-hydroxyprostaglandin dehydrogenase [Trichonephila clavipes]|nr:15-hydroxyprostaglandin dehydrogenase [Trichonephila clavipes]